MAVVSADRGDGEVQLGEEMRRAIRLDGKRLVTVNRDGKRLKLVLELGGRESIVVPGSGVGPRPAPRPPA